MTVAIDKFEKTTQFAPCNSKWGRSLKGEYILTFPELTGKSVFFSATNSSCVDCHMINNNLNIQHKKQTFTDYNFIKGITCYIFSLW